MEPEVCASLDLSTTKSQSGVICLFRDFQQLVTVQEVRDCLSGVKSVLFFVPSSAYRLCEMLRLLVSGNLRSTTRNLHKFRPVIHSVSQSNIFYSSKFVCALDNINK